MFFFAMIFAISTPDPRTGRHIAGLTALRRHEHFAEALAHEPEIAEMLVQARKYEARKKGVKLLPQEDGTTRRRSSRPSSVSH